MNEQFFCSKPFLSTFVLGRNTCRLNPSRPETVPSAKAIAPNRIIILLLRSLTRPPLRLAIHFPHFHCSQTPQFSSWNMAKYCFGNFLTLFRIVFPPPFQSQTAFSTLLSVLPSLPFIIVLCCVWGFLLLLLVFCRIKSLCAHKMDFDSHGARRGWGVSERAHKSQWFLRKSFPCYFWIWKNEKVSALRLTRRIMSLFTCWCRVVSEAISMIKIGFVRFRSLVGWLERMGENAQFLRLLNSINVN